MAELSETTRYLLEREGAFDPNHKRTVANIRKVMELIDGVGNWKEFDERFGDMRDEDRTEILVWIMFVEMNLSTGNSDSGACWKRQRRKLGAIASDIEKGRLHKHPEIREIIQGEALDLEALWRRFEIMSRSLESIAHKQLRQVDLNQSETSTIESYGNMLAYIMLHGGDTYLFPERRCPTRGRCLLQSG